MKNCPLCDKPLIKQSAQDACGYEPDIYCPEEIKLQSGRVVNHYREIPEMEYTDMYVLPYRIRTDNFETKIGVQARYKTRRGVKTNKGKFYFKTLITCPPIHPDTEARLRDRIKLLLLIS